MLKESSHALDELSNQTLHTFKFNWFPLLEFLKFTEFKEAREFTDISRLNHVFEAVKFIKDASCVIIWKFDCGSGAGVLRSPEPVHLGRWNTISVYRHRWDAWLKLNNGKRVRGRSKGLFSRMTFREPVWVGGAGNTTGLQNKLGLSEGLLGCVDFLRINGDSYRLVKDAVSTLDIDNVKNKLETKYEKQK
ncbi:EGF fibronectin type-III and laminin G domain-containing protein [Danaus plexippus plexippus]|uniref:EGF fibronectin type-III and laminin G domain-containing protein n=1 Tax=Danaus plexippus plexippus TaxID=278856 RepID=A0A212EUP9_DANPL|nr:EGF fibronectin type-III and laminin G domain-containing protein [Danaus plexippus plexippus]